MKLSHSQSRFVDNDTIISWSKNRKLKWEDFKGVVDTINSLKFSAVTTSEIHFTVGFLKSYDISKINIITYFFKTKSWSCSSSLETLEHEQLHFDIMELFSRKMRYDFEIKKNKEETEIESYFQSYEDRFKECSIYQLLYDTETNHGTIVTKQLEWKHKVAKELDELEAYKYTQLAPDGASLPK